MPFHYFPSPASTSLSVIDTSINLSWCISVERYTSFHDFHNHYLLSYLTSRWQLNARISRIHVVIGRCVFNGPLISPRSSSNKATAKACLVYPYCPSWTAIKPPRLKFRSVSYLSLLMLLNRIITSYFNH